MPSNEPTHHELQHLSFKLLKQEAMEAHREGDGLRVNLLCQTALDGIDHLIKAGQFGLSLKEIQWVFTFQFYWLLDHFAGYLAGEIFKKLPRYTEEDHEIAAFLECHQYLVQEPLSSWDAASEMLARLPLNALSKESEPPLEESELLTHIVELAWFRNAGTRDWNKFLMGWATHGTRWISELAESLSLRLVWQTRMVAPCSNAPIIEETCIEEVSAHFELADLWLLHLHGRS